MQFPSLTSRNIILLYTGWWIFWMLTQAGLIYHAGFDIASALKDAAISQSILALAGYVTNINHKFYIPGPKNSIYRVIWSAGLTIVSVWTLKCLLAFIFEPLPLYLAFVQETMPLRYVFYWLMIVFITIFSWFWHFMSAQQADDIRKSDMEKLAHEAELSKLRQQLQPHFLFNSLNSISALVLSRPQEARLMIQQLSDFLRGTMKKDEQQLATLQEELQHLELYLHIEKVRFGYRLLTKIEVENRSASMLIPTLLLQPIVENAIKFGLYDTIGETEILIKSITNPGMLVISVSNPYDPDTASPKQGTGFGLNSIGRRLYLLYGRNDLLHTQQIDKTFITTIKIPQNDQSNNH